MANFVSVDDIRVLFSKAMSEMYGNEVPLYNTLVDLVVDINKDTLKADPALHQQLECSDNLARISQERHGAIRLGKEEELFTMRRLFAVMGMFPVGYYDLSVAGIPVHSTAFRPVKSCSLSINPFRVFTSLLRLDLIDDKHLALQAYEVLNQRDIFTPGVRALIEKFEQQGGLALDDSEQFVSEALETFRWHHDATVSADLYRSLHDNHRLIADVVSFKGPHINHLTPRTLDIDTVQTAMPACGITPKEVIEGPPPREVPLLLRQTSFKALEEPVNFIDETGQKKPGTHTARFGEIEQRGVALTRKGRKLYDELLHKAREITQNETHKTYETILAEIFQEFPDNQTALRQQELAFFEYHLQSENLTENHNNHDHNHEDIEKLIESGVVSATPIIYEDFLPVSAAGIFQSNLGADGGKNFSANANQAAFEKALGATVIDEFTLYESIQQESLDKVILSLAS